MPGLPDDIHSLLNLLSSIPYENLSKAVKYSEKGAPDRAMRMPDELLSDYRRMGAGGTCFSLTWLVYNQLKKKGYAIYPVMCDRSYGKNTHCAAILECKGTKYLLDPGFLSFTPLELKKEDKTSVDTVFNTIELAPSGSNRYILTTVYRNEKKYRFTLNDDAVTDNDFFTHWRNSFLMETLTYPVVTMLKGNAHIYLQKKNLYVRTALGSERISIPEAKFPETVKTYFGINEKLGLRARDLFF